MTLDSTDVWICYYGSEHNFPDFLFKNLGEVKLNNDSYYNEKMGFSAETITGISSGEYVPGTIYKVEQSRCLKLEPVEVVLWRINGTEWFKNREQFERDRKCRNGEGKRPRSPSKRSRPKNGSASLKGKD